MMEQRAGLLLVVVRLLLGTRGSFGLKTFAPDSCPPALGGPEMANADLHVLFDHYGSDKGEMKHNYYKAYNAVFQGRRQDVRTLVEIGIGTQTVMNYPPGQSLRSWRDHFPQAQVVGVDISPDASVTGEERVLTVTPVDTTTPTSIDFLVSGAAKSSITLRSGEGADRVGHVDVLIDDGAHDPVMQGRTWSAMYELVKPGGIYVVEDLLHKRGITSVPVGGYGTGEAWDDGKNGTKAAHFCGMKRENPFVFGTKEIRDGNDHAASQDSFTSPELRAEIAENSVFYASTCEGTCESNLMFIQKDAHLATPPLFARGSMPDKAENLYNILLGHGGHSRQVLVQRPQTAKIWNAQFPHVQAREGPSGQSGTPEGMACGLDVLVASMDASEQRSTEKFITENFAKLRRGGYLFVEDVEFSYCANGGFDPNRIPGMREVKQTKDENGTGTHEKNWFWAMTNDDTLPDGTPSKKVLVLRRS